VEHAVNDIDDALDAACRIFDEDHRIVEALDARAHGHVYFFNDYGDSYHVSTIMDGFQKKAISAAIKCSFARIHDVAKQCFRISDFIRSASLHCTIHTADDLPQLIADGMAAIDSASVSIKN
jgi:hypothetical protein